ncbi:MAG: hypothetical protein JKY99_12015 [Rhizobiales bacterium]|nr:hypothetical protein [Hyphomicrobiales bacterium]
MNNNEVCRRISDNVEYFEKEKRIAFQELVTLRNRNIIYERDIVKIERDLSKLRIASTALSAINKNPAIALILRTLGATTVSQAIDKGNSKIVRLRSKLSENQYKIHRLNETIESAEYGVNKSIIASEKYHCTQ